VTAAERRRVLLISGAATAEQAAVQRLRDAGISIVERHDLERDDARDDLATALADSWATVAGAECYTAAILERAASLRVIARPGAGLDHVDVDAASAMGIAVVTTPGANAEGVADFTLALILATLRRIVPVDRAVRVGTWRLDGLSADLAGATVGVVGLGSIGRAVVRRLIGFGCRVLAVESHPDTRFCAEHGVTLTTIEDMLPSVDVLTLHVPLTAATHHLIDATRLATMRPGAILVNTSRGAVVDQDALVRALAAGSLGGAGLDVFEREPLDAGDPLLSMPNVTVSGHQAALSMGSVTAMVGAVVEALLDAREGRVPRGCVNASALARFQDRWAAGASSDGGR
jgi:phosphoglycerate dehydrogenase-like enzyme